MLYLFCVRRLECTVLILKYADVPWSRTIDTIAEKAMLENHPLSAQIREEKQNFPFKKLLKKYVRPLRIPVDTSEEGFPLRLVKYILSQAPDDPDLLDDMNVITARFPEEKRDCSSAVLEHYIRKGQFEAGLVFLRGLDVETRRSTCFRALCFAREFLGIDTMRELSENYMQVLGRVLAIFIDCLPEAEHRRYQREVDRLRRWHTLKVIRLCCVSEVLYINEHELYFGQFC